MILVLSSLDGIPGLSNSNTLFFFHKLYLLTEDAGNLINPYSLVVGVVTVVTGLIARHFKTRYAMLIAIVAGYLC